MRRLATLHLTLLLLPAAAFAQLADPSFETDPLAWELLPCDGATGTLTPIAAGRHGRALRIDKTNGLGYLMLSTRQPIPVQPAKPYESAVHLRVERLEFGARVYFCNQDVDAAGKGLYPVHYSPLYAQTPSFPRSADEWLRHPCRWQTLGQAAGTILRFLLVASPTTLLIDDAELAADPPDPVHKPVTTSHEPPFSAAAAREVLAHRTALPARVEVVSGRPVIAVGGAFRAAILHQGSYYSPQNSRYQGFGRSMIHLQTVCVQLGPDVERADTCWKYPDRFDFSTLEQHLLRAVGADPDVMVVLQVRCDMPRQWGVEHPADVWTAEDGRHWVTPKGDCHPGKLADHLEEGEHYMASYGSPRYLAEMSAAVAELARFIKTSDVGKLVVGGIFAGGNDGQFAGESLGLQLDHSPGHQEGFRSWLKERYRDEAALRTAWGDPVVTFGSATVAPESGRSTDRPLLRDRGPERRTIDSAHYGNVAAATLIKRFARAFKETVGRPVISLTYYPDAVNGQGTLGYAASELLSGPDRLDGAALVQNYGEWRRPGGTGGVTGTWAAHRLRGTLPICEIDYRTYRSYAAGEWGMEDLGATDTAEGFRAQVRRDIGAAATRGMGAWFYDMDGYWYDDPPLWSTIAEAQRILAWAHRPEAPPSKAEMAVFVDEDAGWRIGLDSYTLTNSATNVTRRALNLSGVPYDLYFLDDIRNPRLPDYRMYVLLSAFTVSRAQAAALRSKGLRPGKVLVIPGSPGLGSPDFDGPVAALHAITGLAGRLLPKGAELKTLPTDDPAAAGVAGALIPTGNAPDRLLVPSDPAFTAFGRFLDGGLSHGVARTARGTVACWPAGLHPQVLANLATEAGIRLHGTPGQVTYVGSGVAVAHRVRPGPLQVTFAAPVDLLGTDGETVLARRVTTWEPEVAMLDTEVVFYRAAR